MCGVFLNSHTKRQIGLCQTGCLWTRPCGAKPSSASPNHVRSALSWDTLHSVEW